MHAFSGCIQLRGHSRLTRLRKEGTEKARRFVPSASTYAIPDDIITAMPRMSEREGLDRNIVFHPTFPVSG